jgi:chemotaxis protein methyltransferase CheR
MERLLTITTEQFDRLRRLSLSLAGIQLVDRHRDLFLSRCRRLQIEDSASLDQLLLSAEHGDAPARQRLIALLTTSYTAFFRHPWHFDLAAEHALWAIHRRGHARLWCAAAATGEEPYSLAMALLDVARRDDPPASILASDINPQVLEFARRAEYSEASLRPLSPDQRARFFAEPAGPASFRLAPAPRRLVAFTELNLTSPLWPDGGPFDVIFCRNLLMYIEHAQRHLILERMASLLVPGGLFILDPAEHLSDARHLFKPGRNGVFSLNSPLRDPRLSPHSHSQEPSPIS